MSPVKPSKQRNPRSVVLGIGGVAVAIVLVVVLFVIAIPSLTESGRVQVKLGPDTFDAGPARLRAATVSSDGPILFSDVASGQRDIWVQHTGDDESQGWSAFDARFAGTGRGCTLTWDADGDRFTDPCDGRVVPADGAGLVHYEVTVTDDGHVVIDLKAAQRGPGDTTP